MREDWEKLEQQILAPWAAKAAQSRGRQQEEEPCSLRTLYQRDRDRITHSKAFRRLKRKTQVFVNPVSDHFRTRLTHTLEVTQISRTIGRALALNEDLIEAIALGHDLGHTPFGHAGERALAEILGEFNHAEQSLRVVDTIEREGRGLNLSWEVRNGIVYHSGDTLPATLEGMVVRLSDRIAYINHDIDDAMRAGILQKDSLPLSAQKLGHSHSTRIDTLVKDVVSASQGRAKVCMSDDIAACFGDLRQFLFDTVYFRPEAMAEEEKVRQMIKSLYYYYLNHFYQLPEEYRKSEPERAAADYISGMTDTFALWEYGRLKI